MLTRLGERGGTGGGGPLEPAPEPGLKVFGTRSLRTAGKLTGAPPTAPLAPELLPVLLLTLAPTTVLLKVTTDVGPNKVLGPVEFAGVEPPPTAPESAARRFKVNKQDFFALKFLKLLLFKRKI